MNHAVVSPLLTGWSIVCLRPSMQQPAVRRAVEARGAHHVTLPGLRLESLQAKPELYRALHCNTVVFTSPAAVHYAARLLPLNLPAQAVTFSVGEGTSRALMRHGITALAPAADAMHSDGVLALPQWSDVSGPVGLITAPGGRGIIAAGLAQRGLDVIRANVYQRLPPRFDVRHRRALMQAPSPRAVLVSSGEALEGALSALPREGQVHLLNAIAVCSSPRLVELSQAHGFSQAMNTSTPTPATMLDALAQHVAFTHFR